MVEGGGEVGKGLEEELAVFKDAVLGRAREVCGVRKVGWGGKGEGVNGGIKN